eukprot:SAG11_NODE_20237_length_449_cov_5.391429_1_plen_77_part_10
MGHGARQVAACRAGGAGVYIELVLKPDAVIGGSAEFSTLALLSVVAGVANGVVKLHHGFEEARKGSLDDIVGNPDLA